MSYTNRNYRTNLSMKGLVFLNGKEFDCTIVDLSTNGIKMEIIPGHYFNNVQLFLDAININEIVNFAIPEMHLDGESKIVRKEAQENTIYLSLTFSNVYYGLEHIPYKRKFYRSISRTIGHISLNTLDYEVISQNISLNGMLIVTPEALKVNAGDKIGLNFMQVVFEVNPGPQIRLAEPNFVGNKSVDKSFLSTLVAWSDKDLYHPDLIKKTTNNIAGSNLFSTIRIELDSNTIITHANEQVIPVIISLKESLHRSIKASLGFDTDTGAFIGTTWTHRNFFSSGEKVSIEGAWTGVGPLLDIKYSKPSFFNPRQSFVANIKLQNEDTDAYDSTSYKMSAGIERKLTKGMSISLGLAFRHSQITDKTIENSQENIANEIDSSQNFSLLYTPLKFSWDFSNDLFSPDKGGKLLLQTAPFVDMQSNLYFGKIYASYTHYLKILSSPKVVIASRGAFGKIFGADVYKLPADERFYSGGGGSVRGYGYQLIGPLNQNNNPMGGNALLEFALESRISITQSIATVLFVDAGSAYSSDFFDGSSDVLYGAGFGLRYSSPMGPLRFDFALPVNSRDDVDDSFQIYLSIGQAF